MTTTESRFRCPDCGFVIHNRRYPNCERCAKPLPESLLYSAEEIARLDREAAESAEVREKQAVAEREQKEREDAAAMTIILAASASVVAPGG